MVMIITNPLLSIKLSSFHIHVLQDFCKLALDYLQKGPNTKLYTAAAQKLQVSPEIVKSSAEGLLNLLFESCKYKLNKKDFQDSVIALGFTEEKELLLSKLYSNKKEDILNLLPHVGFKVLEYYNMEWRFEVQIASRCLLKQTGALITLDLAFKNENVDDTEHILVQTDTNNLLNIIQLLEEALQEGRSQHVHRISRIIK
ncbi:COMM domain-containing protein 2 isoform X2 [Prorops nasuta]|uniref:COMM domain-containing protein 2 isoform X2 n=1 Tax=Prorops nasuta TaxID=863751 RepID=UPI0034CD5044